MVIVCIQSGRWVLEGAWQWEMQAEAVYCSDVMDFPAGFEGTKGIIHPDDLKHLTGALALLEDREDLHLSFRIITTYGEVKTVSGQGISLVRDAGEDPEKPRWEEATRELEFRKEAASLQLLKELAEVTERLHNMGSWLVNKTTGEAYYSNNVFRIHGLPAQSLNAHAHTFHSFLHPDDRVAVTDALENAFARELPLHLEYRIVQQGGSIRHLQLEARWLYNEKGQPIFSGILQDITEQVEQSEQKLAAESLLRLQQQTLELMEKEAGGGYWYINLITRKTTFSEGYLRMYGMKPAVVPSTNAFLNMVHPDDRNRVQESMEKMHLSHSLPDLEFRIIRPDGKLRYLRQTAKPVVYNNSELVMIGVVQDITLQKQKDKSIEAANKVSELQKALFDLAEETVKINAVVWYLPEGTMSWSEGFYRLLGYKPGAVEPQQRLIQKSIHPADVKTFSDGVTLALNGQLQQELFFRLATRTGYRQLQLTFRQTTLHHKEAVIGLVQDVTQHAAVKQQLEDEGRFNELLANAVNECIILTNTDHTILHWNVSAEEKTGLERSKVLSQNLFDVFPLLRTDEYLQNLQKALSGEKVRVLLDRHKYLHQPHHYHLMPYKDGQGQIIGVLHVVQDAAQEQALQQRLTERLNFIESLVEASVDRIVVLDRNLNYLYWNHKAEEYYVVPKQRVLGKNILEIFPQFRNDPSYQDFRRVLKGETVYLPAAHNEDSEEHYETYLIPIKDETGAVTAILWIAHDLSQELKLQQEQRRVQKQLAEEHRRLKEAQAIGHIGSFEWDAATDEIYWSDEMFRIHGLEPQSEKPDFERVLSFIHPDDVENWRATVMQCRSTASTFSMTHRIVRADGAVRWVTRQIQSFADDTGAVTHLSGSVQNITERKTAEQEILRLKDEVAQKATDKYYSIFNSIDEGCGIFELLYDEKGKPVDYRFVEVNPAFEQQTGLKDVIGKTGKELTFNTEPYWFEAFNKVAQTGQSVHFENYHAGTGRWYHVHASRIGDADSRFIAIVFDDITEHKCHEQQQDYLLKLNDTLRFLSDPVAIEEAVTQIALNYFGADRCYYCTIEGDHSIIRRDARRGKLPSVAGTYPLSSFALFKKVVDEGRPFVVQDAHTTNILDEPLRQLCLQLQVVSFVDVPVVKNGKAVGILCLVQSTARKWTDTEVALAAETAEHTWAAVERAKAKEALQKSEEQLKNFAALLEQQVAERTASLQQSTEELQKHIAILQQAEELAHIGSWEYDISTGTFNWSEGMYRLFSLPQGTTVRPEIYLDFATEEDRSVAKRIINYLRKGHQPFEETLHIKKDGDTRILKIKGSVVGNERGEAERMIGVDVDLTDITDAEEKLRESQHWLQQTSQTSPVAILIYDLAKKQPYYLNNCLANWMGTTSNALVQMGVEGRLKLVHPNDRLPLLHFNEKVAAAADGDILTLDYRIKTGDDKMIWIRNRSKVFQRDAAGKVTHILSILEDVTEEKTAEESLKELNVSLVKKNKELEARNEEITSFAFISSHDLKEPIRKIHTFSDWLLQEEQDRLSERSKSLLEKITASVKRLDLLINDILALTKIHKEKGKKTPVDLNRILNQATEEMEGEITATRAEIHAGNLPVVPAIGSQLVYLFKNLISNALKFQPEGNIPQITIRAERVDARELKTHPEATGTYIRISFKDNGIGFEPKYRKKIFQVFQRLHGREAFEGTGMGLAICHKIMENHNGFISAESEPGKGATFCCYFPVHEP